MADARLEDEEHLAAVYQGKMEKSVDNAIDGIDMETIFTEEEMSALGYDKHPDDVAAEEEPEQPPMVEDREHPDYHRFIFLTFEQLNDVNFSDSNTAAERSR